MTQEVFANNASTTLGSALSSGATTCTVASGTGNSFPALTGGQFFSATLFAAGSDTGIPNEIVYVTGRSGDTMTMLRGQEGTTPQAWNVGDTFANYPTAGFLNSLLQTGQLQQQATNSANDAGSANAGVITLAPAPLSLAGILLSPIRVLKEADDNTGAYTLNVNGFGAIPVVLQGNPLEAGQLLASQVFEVIYDGTNFELISVPGHVDNVNLAIMGSMTVKGNNTGAGAKPMDIAISSLIGGLFGPQLIATNGYISLPNFTDPTKPLILQWTRVFSSDPGTAYSFSWPIAFPNACFTAIAGGNPGLNYSGSYSAYLTAAATTTGGTVYGNNGGHDSSTVTIIGLGN